MAEDKTLEQQAQVKASRMKKGRKTINYLQALKDEGTPIVQMCPAGRDQFFTQAADLAGVDVCRLTVPGDGSDPDMQIEIAPWWIRCVRKAAPNIHINFYMQTPTYASKELALANGARYMNNGADSLLPMGVSNETLRYMADNYLPVFGHVGALSGWQTSRQGGYKRMGKTAEDAMKVFKMASLPEHVNWMHMTGASILGGDTIIGANSVVGGNAFLTSSVNPETRVVIRAPETTFKNS